MVERFHRQLKASIKAHATERWVQVLPAVLLGIRSSLKEDIGASSAELVYGTTIRLPGEFFRSSDAHAVKDQQHYLTLLRDKMQELRPTPASHHTKSTFYVHKSLTDCSHVFLRVDTVRKPLQQPYTGPHKVISRGDKCFDIFINGTVKTVSIDRLKPAFVLGEDLQVQHSDQQKKVTTRSGRTVKFRFPDLVQHRT